MNNLLLSLILSFGLMQSEGCPMDFLTDSSFETQPLGDVGDSTPDQWNIQQGGFFENPTIDSNGAYDGDKYLNMIVQARVEQVSTKGPIELGDELYYRVAVRIPSGANRGVVYVVFDATIFPATIPVEVLFDINGTYTVTHNGVVQYIRSYTLDEWVLIEGASKMIDGGGSPRVTIEGQGTPPDGRAHVDYFYYSTEPIPGEDVWQREGAPETVYTDPADPVTPWGRAPDPSDAYAAEPTPDTPWEEEDC